MHSIIVDSGRPRNGCAAVRHILRRLNSTHGSRRGKTSVASYRCELLRFLRVCTGVEVRHKPKDRTERHKQPAPEVRVHDNFPPHLPGCMGSSTPAFLSTLL